MRMLKKNKTFRGKKGIPPKKGKEGQGYGSSMGRFEQFRFSVPTVPLWKGFLLFQYWFNRKERFRFRFRFLKTSSPRKAHKHKEMGPQSWTLDPTPKTPLDPPPPRNSLCTVFCWEKQHLHKEFGRLSPLLDPPAEILYADFIWVFFLRENNGSGDSSSSFGFWKNGSDGSGFRFRFGSQVGGWAILWKKGKDSNPQDKLQLLDFTKDSRRLYYKTPPCAFYHVQKCP